jgi:hypothetical protein
MRNLGVKTPENQKVSSETTTDSQEPEETPEPVETTVKDLSGTRRWQHSRCGVISRAVLSDNQIYCMQEKSRFSASEFSEVS